MKKISEDQLKEIQGINGKFLQAKVGIADAELNKAKLIAEINTLQSEFKAVEQKLIKEYGQDAVIDLKTGEVKPPEKKEENGKNK
tara:strand:+ start:2593 stop:2847 length:255 start_codon:yes stop_codon:yes gene_type:complete